MSAQKGFCEDLTEGKFSFPIIHAVHHSASANNELLNILKSKPESVAIKEHAVSYMRNVTGSFAYTKSKLNTLLEHAMMMLGTFGEENQSMRAILERLIAD